MREFVLRIGLFLFPIALAVALVESYFGVIGETWTVHTAVQYQAVHPDAIFGRGFFPEETKLYKEAMARSSGPKIAIFGSSRVMQFRSSFLSSTQPDSVLNLGGIINSAEDLMQLKHSPVIASNTHLEWLIIGIDPWWFTTRPSSKMEPDLLPMLARPSEHIKAYRRLARELSQNGIPTGNHNDIMPVGYLAWAQGAGFRSDGSRRYAPDQLERFARSGDYVDRESPPVIARVRSHSRQFRSGSIDLTILHQVADSLDGLANRGINVTVFSLPMSSEIWRHMERDPYFRGLRDLILIELPLAFEKPNINWLSVDNTAALGLDDRYMIDGFHPSEVFVAHMMLTYFRTYSPTQTGEIRELQKQIESASSSLQLEWESDDR